MTIARGIAKGIGAGVAKPITVASGGGAAALDIRAQVGTSTSPTSTGTRAVTNVGFTPKVVLPFGVGQAAVGADVQAVMGFGAGASSSSRASISVSSANAVTTSDTDRKHTAAQIHSILTAAGADFLASDLSAIDADGFTLNWSTVLTTARILNHIALGGSDLEVSLTQQQMNGTNAAQSFAHGLSGAPTGVLFFSSAQVAAPPSTGAQLDMSIGCWAGSNQFAAVVHSATGVTTTTTRRVLMTDGVVAIGGATITRKLAVGSVDATNVNCTYPVTGVTQQHYFFMLAIRGAKCQVGTFDCNGSTSPLTINTPGITPKLFLPVFVPVGVASAGTVLNELFLTIGASDGTNSVSCGISDENAKTTTSARRYQSSSAFVEYNGVGTQRFEATAAFSGQSVIITPTLANASFGAGGYLVIGS